MTCQDEAKGIAAHRPVLIHTLCYVESKRYTYPERVIPLQGLAGLFRTQSDYPLTVFLDPFREERPSLVLDGLLDGVKRCLAPFRSAVDLVQPEMLKRHLAALEQIVDRDFLLAHGALLMTFIRWQRVTMAAMGLWY